jgi:hypothetical protein
MHSSVIIFTSSFASLNCSVLPGYHDILPPRHLHHNSYYSYIILIRASKVYKRGAESSSQPSGAGDIATIMKE